MKKLFTLLSATLFSVSIAFGQVFPNPIDPNANDETPPVAPLRQYMGIQGGFYKDNGGNWHEPWKNIMNQDPSTNIFTYKIFLPKINQGTGSVGYGYIVTFDGIKDNQANHGARNKNMRYFELSEDREVTFYAKAIETKDGGGVVTGYQTQFICDAQVVALWMWNADLQGSLEFPLPDADGKTSLVFDIPNTNKKREFKIQANDIWQDFQEREKGQEISYGNYGRYKFDVDYKTISYTYNKVLDVIETPEVIINGGLPSTPSTSSVDLGEYNSSTPLFIGGNVSTSSITAIDLANVTSQIICEITKQGESTSIIKTVPLTTTLNGEQTQATFSNTTGIDVSTGLDAGTYTMKYKYAAICHGDTLTANNTEYEATFDVSDTPTSVESANVNDVIIISGNGSIDIKFEGTKNISLYSITGLLIDYSVSESSYFKTVNNGIYVINIDNKAYKVAVK